MKTILKTRLETAWALGADDRGGVAVIFALAVIPVAFLSLVMLDYSRASTAKQGLQENLDAATLIAARSTAISADDVDRIGEQAFIAQLSADTGISGLAPGADGRYARLAFTPNGAIVSGESQQLETSTDGRQRVAQLVG